MPNTKQDRSKVVGKQDHEVDYEAKKTGASESEVKDAVKSVGNSRKAVEKKLRGQHVGSVDLCRRSILVVEDDYLLAAGITDQVEDHNGLAVGPAMTLVEGMDLLRREQPDACILNIRLGPDMVYPLADQLLASGIPFVFASAEHRSSIPHRFAKAPLHAKPIDMVQAAAALMRSEEASTE